MRNDLTELVFILDRSGSMSGLEGDTIGGFNSLLAKQKREPGAATLTTVLFNDEYKLLHNRVDIQRAEALTERDYCPCGCTALLDAVARTINWIGDALSAAPEPERPGHVLFVITTDGLENASQEYTHEKVKAMIRHQQEKYSWEFIFLGANIDAVETAASLGIARDRASDFLNDSEGVECCYEAVSCAASGLRADCKFAIPEFLGKVRADYNSRKSSD